MKGRDFEKLSRKLLPDFPGFVAKGRMFFRPPVHNALGTVFFDSSGYDATYFTVRVIVVPLFIQTDHIYFNFGKEIYSGGGYWKSNDPGLLDNLRSRIRQEALPVLAHLDTYEGVADAALLLKASADPLVLRAVAFAYFLSGKTDQACRELDRLIAQLAGSRGAEQHHERICHFRDLILSNPEAFRSQLINEESATARALGLDKYR